MERLECYAVRWVLRTQPLREKPLDIGKSQSKWQLIAQIEGIFNITLWNSSCRGWHESGVEIQEDIT
jgi:hypothetical protein